VSKKEREKKGSARGSVHWGCHDSLDVAVSYMGLGDVYESLGKFEEALEMHTKSLDIQTRIHGGDHHSRYCATAHDI
jgi:hypothetical protein